MENITKPDNKIFIATFAGVVLLIVSIAMSLLTTKATIDLPYIVGAIATGVSAVGLLTYSVRMDKYRLAE